MTYDLQTHESGITPHVDPSSSKMTNFSFGEKPKSFLKTFTDIVWKKFLDGAFDNC